MSIYHSIQLACLPVNPIPPSIIHPSIQQLNYLKLTAVNRWRSWPKQNSIRDFWRQFLPNLLFLSTFSADISAPISQIYFDRNCPILFKSPNDRVNISSRLDAIISIWSRNVSGFGPTATVITFTPATCSCSENTLTASGFSVLPFMSTTRRSGVSGRSPSVPVKIWNEKTFHLINTG